MRVPAAPHSLLQVVVHEFGKERRLWKWGSLRRAGEDPFPHVPHVSSELSVLWKRGQLSGETHLVDPFAWSHCCPRHWTASQVSHGVG